MDMNNWDMSNLADQRSKMLLMLLEKSYSRASVDTVTGHFAKLGDSMNSKPREELTDKECWEMATALEKEAKEKIIPLIEMFPEEQVIQKIEAMKIK